MATNYLLSTVSIPVGMGTFKTFKITIKTELISVLNCAVGMCCNEK